MFPLNVYTLMLYFSLLLHAAATVLSFSGSDDLKKFTDLLGNSYLTSHRLIFLSKSPKSALRSFSIPFCVMSEVDVEQPVFGANFLKGKVRAQPNGNWRGEAKFKIQFKAGGAIDFAQGMMKAIQIGNLEFLLTKSELEIIKACVDICFNISLQQERFRNRIHIGTLRHRRMRQLQACQLPVIITLHLVIIMAGCRQVTTFLPQKVLRKRNSICVSS